MIKTIKKKSEFSRIYKNGISIKTKNIIVIGLKSNIMIGKYVGYTASKKVGKAVIRNKSKRRLRHIVHELEELIPVGFSIVFIANRNTPVVEFKKLRNDMLYSIRKIINSTC